MSIMVEDKSSKGGVGTRAKKFMSSKTASTKLGRKAILKVLGSDGEILFNAIKESAKLHFGDKKGKQLKEDMLKLIMKVHVMVKNNLLTAANTTAGQEPTNRLLFQAKQDFEQTDTRTDVEPLSEEIKNFGSVWSDIVSKKMQEKNISKLQDVVAMLSNVVFLEKLFNAEDYADHREQISNALARMMLTMGVFDMNESAECQVSSCSNRATRSRGIFRSGGFCAMHHESHFHPMITKPTLNDFMAEDRSSLPLVEFLSTHNNANSFHFLKAVADFKSISSPKIRLRSVKLIERKFLALESPMKIEDCDSIAEIIEKVEAIDEDEPKTPTSLFKGVEQHAWDNLNSVFLEEFTKSKEFERFCMSYRLPEDLLDAAKTQRKKSL